MFEKIRCLLPVMALIVVALPGQAAEKEIAFGPRSIEITESGPQSFTIDFDSALAGDVAVHMINDGVTAATVAVNGAPIVLANEPLGEALTRPATLDDGGNRLTLDLVGQPGSLLTIMIAEPGPPPPFVAGRLLLVWGRSDADHTLRLALKNGSRKAPRVFRVLFFRPDGELVAASKKVGLPPRGSAVFNVEEIIAKGHWNVGSIEILYTGPGKARLFGTARQGDPTPLPQSATQPLMQAGLHLFKPDGEPAP